MRLYRRERIGFRLTWSFLLIGFLMMASDVATLWQFSQLRDQAAVVRLVDEEAHAVLTVHAGLLMLRDKLNELAASQDSRHFAVEGGSLRDRFLAEIERANHALRVSRSAGDRDPTMWSTLETVQSAVPAQINALIDLANAGDWRAVRLRLQNQVAPLSSLTSSVVEKVDTEVAEERTKAQASIEHVQERVFFLLPLTALVTLLCAALLGVIVTRSIVRPLEELDSAAQALAQGNFQYRVPSLGHDELAALARAFNDAAQRLSDLYGALKSSEVRYRSVITAMAEGVVLQQADGKIIACNRSAEQILGVSAGKLLGQTPADRELVTIHPDGTPFPAGEHPAMITLRSGTPQVDVCMGVRKASGGLNWISINSQPLFQEGESIPFAVVSTFTDITERKRAEEALRQSEEEFHTIFDHAAIGMVLVDPLGHPLRCNPAFLHMLDYGEKELAGRTLFELAHPADVAVDHSLFQELVEGRRHQYQVRKRYLRKSGDTRWARLTVSALRTENDKLQYCVAMVEDITSQEVAERRLLEMSRRLLHIQEEEQRRIAREVHDSTSQEITALTLNLGALRSSAEQLPALAREQVTESLALAKRVAREIRTFSYLLHPPMLNELGIWQALRMFLDEFRERSGLEVGLEISPEAEEINLTNDQEMALFRFIQAALANVHRHSGSKTANVKIDVNGRRIEAFVCDSGRGIPPDVLKAIQQSDARIGGVGVPGMRERIGYVGGELRIESSDRGTTVAATIPIEPRAA